MGSYFFKAPKANEDAVSPNPKPGRTDPTQFSTSDQTKSVGHGSASLSLPQAQQSVTPTITASLQTLNEPGTSTTTEILSSTTTDHDLKTSDTQCSEGLTQMSSSSQREPTVNGCSSLAVSQSSTSSTPTVTSKQLKVTDPEAVAALQTFLSVSNPTVNHGVAAHSILVNRDFCLTVIQQQSVKEDSSEDFAHRFTQLQTMLKRRYNALTMKGLPWMGNINLTLEKYYVTLQMTITDSGGRDLLPKDTTIEETFKVLDGQHESIRILVEGGAGYGKSTLGAKLAYDWSKNCEYVLHFDIVLFIPLRNFEKSWKETLFNAARLHDDDDREMLLKMLRGNAKRFLIIFDGYDELSESYVGEVNAIIQREILPDVTVVVTSRPGKITPDMEEEGREWFIQPKEVALDITRFLDKKIEIMGFSKPMQRVFIETHTAGFTESVRQSVMQNFTQIQTKEVLTSDFLQCPLFLLMIILLLTDKQVNIQSLKTRTDLYKKVFNFVIRRYFAKYGDSTVPKMELFSFERDKTSTYLRVMMQFSHFALNAVQSNTFAFSREDILDTHADTLSTASQDSQQLIPLNLGFLTESLMEEGFQHETIYEPIHKSLLEFAAAYCVWWAFLDGQQDVWQKHVHSLRPRKDFQLKASTSLVFPFLAGLMGKEAWNLFHTLLPHAAEYSLWFGSLKLSLLETQITPELLPFLGPLLPIELIVKWSEEDKSFARSSNHEKIIRYGFEEGKIKTLVWNPYIEVFFPQSQTVVERIVLELYSPDQWGYNFPTSGIRCQDLWCCLMDSGENIAWGEAMSFAKNIQFERISFATFSGSHAILNVCESATDGELQSVDITWIRYVVDDDHSYIKEISDLIIANKVEALELVLHHCDSTEAVEGYNNLYTPMINQQLQQKWCGSITQDQMNHLVKCAAKSTKLVRFIIDNDPHYPFKIDLSVLCDKGNKSWKLIHLSGISIHCSMEIENSFEISHLQIIDADLSVVLDLANNLLQYCEVSFFAYSHSKLLRMTDLSFLNNSVKELHLQIDGTVHQHGIPLYPSHLCNLQILVLEMTSFVCQPVLLASMEKLFPFVTNILHLHGIELLGVEHNNAFVSAFIDKLINGLSGTDKETSQIEGSTEPNTIQTKVLCLEYLVVHTEMHPKKIRLDPVGEDIKEKLCRFLAVISQLKTALRQHLLPRLDLVCYQEVLRYIWSIEGGEVLSLNEIFPMSEGYRFEYDLYGMRDDDSIHSKELYSRTPLPHKRISIMFNQ